MCADEVNSRSETGIFDSAPGPFAQLFPRQLRWTEDFTEGWQHGTGTQPEQLLLRLM
jgi:hypothetical protein